MYYGHWFDGPDQTCSPTGTMLRLLLLSPTYWGTYCYSPGLYYPGGWATAGQLSESWNGIEITSSTSGAICCPFMATTPAAINAAVSSLQKETVTLAASGIIATSTLPTPLTVYADRIPLIWEASDLPKSTSVLQTSTSSSFDSTSTLPQQVRWGHSGQSGLEQGKDRDWSKCSSSAFAVGAGVFFYILRRHRERRMNHTRPLSEMYVRPSGPGGTCLLKSALGTGVFIHSSI
ncbi:uncharacterized protein P174DRAFT_396030 [Aspergillus novofumigatus IBT 16806]|uniref:Uncharacterized protein n=1 Tax=Aspergillus novofumigatus (strain IBT 16806) TaxID=1392255 RepID=A0A2I1BYK2_ASPN1|nr:uncharacterized protein P174DRAFT_396030 [Aspergillus novofumigatus IBT 16806]PKX90458.1 hypothetical protein P174DRAFT_396030 [Aspergillus novofumigatus IBT 16806]